MCLSRRKSGPPTNIGRDPYPKSYVCITGPNNDITKHNQTPVMSMCDCPAPVSFTEFDHHPDTEQEHETYCSIIELKTGHSHQAGVLAHNIVRVIKSCRITSTRSVSKKRKS